MVTGQLWRLGPDIRSEILRAENPRSALGTKLKFKYLGQQIEHKRIYCIAH